MSTTEIFKTHRVRITCTSTDMPLTNNNINFSAIFLQICFLLKLGKEPFSSPMTIKNQYTYYSLVKELIKLLIINCSEQFVIK